MEKKKKPFDFTGWEDYSDHTVRLPLTRTHDTTALLTTTKLTYQLAVGHTAADERFRLRRLYLSSPRSRFAGRRLWNLGFLSREWVYQKPLHLSDHNA